MGDIFDNLVSLLLAQGKVVARGIELADHVNKRVHRERIVLARHAEVRHALRGIFVFVLKQFRLFEHLTCIAQEGFALFETTTPLFVRSKICTFISCSRS